MLLSEHPALVFVHVYKNAGTSIRRSLLRAGLEDQSAVRGLSSHATVAEIISVVGENEFRNHLSFAVVRNPWDWQVSLYRYVLEKPNHHQYDMIQALGSFDAYIDWRCREEVRLQKNFVTDSSGHILVDRILKFENLAHEFQSLCDELGVVAQLPHLNASKRSQWQECYNEQTFDLVRETFAADIGMFGYGDCEL
jgi:hypothetical protein